MSDRKAHRDIPHALGSCSCLHQALLRYSLGLLLMPSAKGAITLLRVNETNNPHTSSLDTRAQQAECSFLIQQTLREAWQHMEM